MNLSEERIVVLIGLVAVLFVTAHLPWADSPIQVAGFYLYWLFRIAIEALFFLLIRAALSTYGGDRLGFWKLTFLAIVASHIPFVLSVTALDIVLGYPELGIGAEGGEAQSRLSAFLLEMVYLADNHLGLCLLLSLPRLLTISPAIEPSKLAHGTQSTLLSSLHPPLNGDIIWVEAQEHYVRVTTDQENRMVLARFSDVVRELNDQEGIQVHRSHWVRRAAILTTRKRGQNLQLELSSGDLVPVSRSYRQQVIHLLEQS